MVLTAAHAFVPMILGRAAELVVLGDKKTMAAGRCGFLLSAGHLQGLLGVFCVRPSETCLKETCWS